MSDPTRRAAELFQPKELPMAKAKKKTVRKVAKKSAKAKVQPKGKTR